ncbi:MAG: ABC1 kinase family protein [Candidatus Nanopelagicales bacterium]
MPDIPLGALKRGARLATLPIGLAGRTAVGVGKRIGGAPAEAVAAQVQARTAEQLFKVLGELKGGAMKAGQALSIFEAAMPEELAGPYRVALTKLQEAAPPLPVASVHKVLTADFGPAWRSWFQSFDDMPAAAASIGQVHRAVWSDGTPVAVKIKYPGADRALLGDLGNVTRLAKMMTVAMPGVDVGPILDELKARVSEELDYPRESANQERFQAAYQGDSQILVAHARAATANVLVSDWIDGTPLSQVIAEGDQAARDHAATLYLTFLAAGPARVGLLHADPHPGNFRITADGRLGVLDFGAVADLPGGLKPVIGRLLHRALAGDGQEVLDGLIDEGFVKPGTKLDTQALMDFLAPFVEPAQVPTFRFSRTWLRTQFTRLADPRNQDTTLAMKMALPPDYLLVYRVWMGGLGVLCQLEAEVPARAVLEQWLPGFAQ